MIVKIQDLIGLIKEQGQANFQLGGNPQSEQLKQLVASLDTAIEDKINEIVLAQLNQLTVVTTAFKNNLNDFEEAFNKMSSFITNEGNKTENIPPQLPFNKDTQP